MRWGATLVLLGFLLLLGRTLYDRLTPPPPIRASVNLREALSDTEGVYSTVTPGRAFRFPEDHGEHPGFKTEWWYFTGNLADAEGRPYGYQLTFFRSGLPQQGQGPWAASDVMMAHFAVSDPQRQAFYPYERLARRALGLSGVESGPSQPLRVWLENWSLERDDQGWRLEASETLPGGKPLRLSLLLTESKPPILQGDGGYSRKGPKSEHSSYYVSLTRLASEGTLQLGERTLPVTGWSWFDHEWSSTPMAPGLVGWDWFSLQLDDGWELMIYMLRYEDGRVEAASSGTLVDPQGKSQHLPLSAFSVEVLERHTSPRGVLYPSGWRLRLPQEQLELTVQPRMKDQEMSSSVSYWEGAVTVQGQRQGRPIQGSGFVEMTGY